MGDLLAELKLCRCKILSLEGEADIIKHRIETGELVSKECVQLTLLDLQEKFLDKLKSAKDSFRAEYGTLESAFREVSQCKVRLQAENERLSEELADIRDKEES